MGYDWAICGRPTPGPNIGRPGPIVCRSLFCTNLRNVHQLVYSRINRPWAIKTSYTFSLDYNFYCISWSTFSRTLQLHCNVRLLS